jgi:polyphosphate kinase
MTEPLPLLNRELSILAFNARVLALAEREDMPLLERLRFICIVSSNLDEFFEIRYADVVQPDIARGGQAAIEQARLSISEHAHRLVERQYRLFNEVVSPALYQAGVVVIPYHLRDERQAAWVKDFFHREVKPLLLPVSLDPAHPFPQVANKSLNFIVRLAGKDAFGRSNPIAIVKVPRVLPRVIKLPESISGGKQAFVLLTSVMRAHLHELFPDRTVEGFSQFRVTRDSDLTIDEQDVPNLRKALRLGLTSRHYGSAVRLEVAKGCPDELARFLLDQFGLTDDALYRVDGPVNLVRLDQLIGGVSGAQFAALRFAGFTPAWPKDWPRGADIFETLRAHDILLHHPFESFEPVIEFLRQAVHDPKVLAIKQTIYRTGDDSALMELLVEAARRGKEVTVVVELKARFDEEANINWAERLEQVGVQVVYGVVGLKTHAKLLLVTRREGQRLKRYAHLSTGNYNPRTARLYTDIGFLSADADLCADVDAIFGHLASQTRVGTLKKIKLAPFALHRHFLDEIERCAQAAAQGKKARIVVKMNALTDPALIEALVRAGQAGVRIALVVRGACMLPAGVKGKTDRIVVRSIVGRFLEHSRIFYFSAGRDESLWLSSADWMGRNMFRRIEVAWPITDRKQRQRIIDEALVPYLHDGVDAWKLQPDGRYLPAKGRQPSAQQALLQRFAAES